MFVAAQHNSSPADMKVQRENERLGKTLEFRYRIPDLTDRQTFNITCAYECRTTDCTSARLGATGP
jgi:hypothetical protein